MAKQRYIKDSFWTDPYIEELGVSEKLLFLYLLTNKHVNVAGIYEITIKQICFETGIDKKNVSIILEKLTNDGKLIYIDSRVILVNFIKNQAINPSIEKGIERVLGELPKHISNIINIEKILMEDKGRIGNTTKDKIKDRDGYKCVQCGRKEFLEVDHKIALCLGGDNSEDNLQTLCEECYRIKTRTDMCMFFQQAGTGSDRLGQAGTYFTLLNSTLPNANEGEQTPKQNLPEVDKIEVAFFNEDSVNKIFKEYLNNRKTKATKKSIELLQKTLNKYPDKIKIKMIEKSIMNGWTGIFELGGVQEVDYTNLANFIKGLEQNRYEEIKATLGITKFNEMRLQHRMSLVKK